MFLWHTLSSSWSVGPALPSACSKKAGKPREEPFSNEEMLIDLRNYWGNRDLFVPSCSRASPC